MKIMEAHAEVEKVMKGRKSGARNCRELKDYEGFRQGDVYLLKVDSDKSLARAFKEISSNPNRKWSRFAPTVLVASDRMQLVDGGTKGSRHIASGNCRLEFYEGGHPCLGGLVIATGDWTLNHPDHANGNMGAGWFLFWYQMDASKSREAQRVMD